MSKLFYSVLSSLIFLPISAQAQQGVPKLDNPLKVGTIPDLIDNITMYLVNIGGSIVVIMILIGAFKMLMAAGNENKFSEGKKTVTYAVIGMAVILLSRGAALIIKDVLGAK